MNHPQPPTEHKRFKFVKVDEIVAGEWFFAVEYDGELQWQRISNLWSFERENAANCAVAYYYELGDEYPIGSAENERCFKMAMEWSNWRNEK